MIEADFKIIDNDKMLNNLEFNTSVRYDGVFQEDRENTSIIKFIYKKDNGAFEQRGSESPRMKCIFDLHTDKKSSYITVYDRNDNIVLEGNYLWNNPSANSYEEYLSILKRLHDYKTVIKNFK